MLVLLAGVGAWRLPGALTLLASSAALSPVTSSRDAPTTSSGVAGAAAVSPVAAAVAAVDEFAAGLRSTRLGVAVLDRATGELVAGWAGSAPLYAASIVKLIVAVDVLARAGGQPLSP